MGWGTNAADGSDGRPLKIFINYRHADTQGTAWAIYMKLEQHFGHESVFFDHGALQPGMRWFDEIESHSGRRGVFISLIGRRWMQILTAHQQQGVRTMSKRRSTWPCGVADP